MEDIEEDLLNGIQKVPPLNRDDIENIKKGLPVTQAINTLLFLRENADTYRILLGPKGDSGFRFKWKKGISRIFMHYYRLYHPNSGKILAQTICSMVCAAIIGLYESFLDDESGAISDEQYSIMIGNLLPYYVFSTDIN